MEKLNLRKFCTIGAIAAFVLGLFAKNVRGQEDRYGQSYQFFRAEIARIESARYRIGPFRIFPRISLNLGYDNNVFRSNSPEFTIADYSAGISTPVSVYLRYKTWLIFSISERPSYDYYFKTKGLRGLSNSVSSQIRMLLINRFVISGGVFKNRIRRRVTVEFDSPVYENHRGFNVGLSFEPGERVSFGLSGGVGELQFEDRNVSQRLNRKVKNIMLTLFYRLSAGSRFFLRGGYSNYSFQYSADISRDTDSVWINSGITFPLFGRIRGIFSLGYSKVMPRDELWPDFSGVVGNTALTWSINRFRFRINYVRNTSFSLGSNIYFVNERAGFGVSFFLTSFIRLGYDFRYGEAKYPLPALDSAAGAIIDDNTRLDIYRTHTARIIFRLIRNTGIGIDVTYWERDSSFIGLSRKNTFVFIYLTTAFNL